jgi:hypothetical protein
VEGELRSVERWADVKFNKRCTSEDAGVTEESPETYSGFEDV